MSRLSELRSQIERFEEARSYWFEAIDSSVGEEREANERRYLNTKCTLDSLYRELEELETPAKVEGSLIDVLEKRYNDLYRDIKNGLSEDSELFYRGKMDGIADAIQLIKEAEQWVK